MSLSNHTTKAILLAVAAIQQGNVCLAENLALGRPCTFSHQPNYGGCTDSGDSTDLTDGVRNGSVWSRKSTVGWVSGEKSKSIEIDLGQICSVDGLTFASGADTRTQVTFPLAVMVFLSDDGKTYSYVGDLINEAVNQEKHAIHTFKMEGLADQARYVRLQTISGGYYVFVDEIEVLGSKKEGLKPLNRMLTPDTIALFAKDRIPVLRQKNSSLTFLAHALSRLEKEPDKYETVARRARAALEKLRSEILARTEHETTDFRRGVPFTKLDGGICQVIGDYLATTGRSPLAVYPTDPWAPLLPFDWDASSTALAPLVMLQNEWGELAFNVTNSTADTMKLSVTIGDLQAGTIPGPTTTISLYEVKFVEAYGFRLRADALMPLNGKLEIPPGMTKQLWLTIDSRGLRPGEYKGTIQLTGSQVSASQPVVFTVAPVKMPAEPTLNVTTFSYMHWPIAKSDPKGVARNLHEHYVNVQQVISPYLPYFEADAEGNFTKPMDFSKLDEYMELLPETRLWILWTGFEWDHRQMHPKEGDDRRTKVFTRWLKDVIAHLKKKGYGYDEFAFTWMDEPSQKEMRDIVKPSSELLRRVDPQARVWMTISGGNATSNLAEFEGLIDIWCPTESKLGGEFWQGKRTWFYGSSSEKGRSPTGHYRYKLWKAFKHGCEGNGFWVYTDGNDLWDDYAGAPTYSVVYDGPRGVISSKRWEAYRAGVEDYELCKLLGDTIDAARSSGRGNLPEVKAAERSLDRHLKIVLDNRDSTIVAEQAHQALLRRLVILSASN